MRRSVSGAALSLLLFLVAADGLFWVFGLLSMHRGNPYRLYAPGQLEAGIQDRLSAEAKGSVTGWPREGGFPLRPRPDLGLANCGSAWGGSFTFADDVSDTEAWPQALSELLRCQIDNRGIDGFGLDQTLLHYRAHEEKNTTTILALVAPMIFVDALSSLTFVSLNPDNSPQVGLTKPRFVGEDGDQRLISRPQAEVTAIESYLLSDDSAAEWEPMKFPFAFHIVRAMIRKRMRTPLADRLPTDPAMMRLQSLAIHLIGDMATIAAQRNNRFVLVLLPAPKRGSRLDSALLAIRDAAPASACVIDPSDELSTLARLAALNTTSGHFTAGANKAIAVAVTRGMKNCGIAS